MMFKACSWPLPEVVASKSSSARSAERMLVSASMTP
jgi:hypothetical protein